MGAAAVLLAGATALLAAFPRVAAGEDEPKLEVTLEEVVVDVEQPQTPRDTAVGAAGPGKEELATRKAATGDAAELLRGVSGITLNGAGGISSLPAIHGLADDRLRIQVDGADLVPACPNHMNSTLSYADPSRIESVTVFSGITPVSVGGDSIGGSIQVKSAPPRFAAAGQDLLTSGLVGGHSRSDGSGLGYTLGAGVAGEWLSLALRQSDSRSDDLLAGGAFKPVAPGREGGPPIPGDVIASSAYHGAVRRSLELALRSGPHLLQVEASQQLVGFEGFPNQRMDMTMNDNRLLTLHYTAVFGWGDLDARLTYQDTRHEMDMGPNRYAYGTGMPMDTEARTWGGGAKVNLRLAPGSLLRAGAEAQVHVLYDSWPAVGGAMGPNTFWNVDYGQRLRFDAYGEWEARWGPRWLTLVGLRSDTVLTDAGPVQGYDDGLPAWGLDAAAFNASARRRLDANWDLAALARWTPDANQTYEGGYARKSRSPSLYQRYAWSTNAMAALMNNLLGDGNGYVGRIDLAPEVAHTVSATGDWHDALQERWSVKVTLHATHVDDYIDARRCDFGQCGAANAALTDGFVLLQYANVSARLYGADASARLLLAEGEAWGALTGSLTASALRGEVASTGDGLYGVMPPSALASLSHKLGGWTGAAEVQAVAAKRHVSQVRNEVRTEAYGLVNLRAAYEWRFLRVDGAVENLLDRLYTNPLGGAYVGQGPSMSTTGIPWGVGVPGAGRSLNLALTCRF